MEAKGDLFGDMGVDVGGDDAAMAEEYLDCADIFTVFQQVGGIGVAQSVDRG